MSEIDITQPGFVGSSASTGFPVFLYNKSFQNKKVRSSTSLFSIASIVSPIFKIHKLTKTESFTAALWASLSPGYILKLISKEQTNHQKLSLAGHHFVSPVHCLPFQSSFYLQSVNHSRKLF